MERPRETMQEALNAFLAERPVRPVAPAPGEEAAKAAAASTPNPPKGKEELLAAFDKLVEHEATKPRGFRFPQAAKWKKFVQPVIIATSAALIAYLGLARPAWLYPRFEPIPAPATPLQAEQTLIAAAVVVEEFQASTGRLPNSLAEAGVDLPFVSLLPEASGGFRLLGGMAAMPLTLRAEPGKPPVIERVIR